VLDVVTSDSPSSATHRRHRSIFDKLTDPSLYTGSHRHRFDESGRGRGLEGRESIAKGLGTEPAVKYRGEGTVTTIAQLMRNEVLDPGYMNKMRRFEDGSTVLSPRNRDRRRADTCWDETPRHLYLTATPTHQRQRHLPPGSADTSRHRWISTTDDHDSGSDSGLTTQRRSRSASRSRSFNRSPTRPLYGHDVEALRYDGGNNNARYDERARASSPSPSSSRSASSSSFAHWPAAATARASYDHQLTPTPRRQQHQQRPQTAQYQPSPIFDKLTDPNLYTGTHKHRFDEYGRGLGLAGRVDVSPERYQCDSYASAKVTDLSQITRTQFNVGSLTGKMAKKFLP